MKISNIVQGDKEEVGPFTLPQFIPHSAETSLGSRLEARLKVRLAHL